MNKATKYGGTALIGASQNGHGDVVRLLLGASGIHVRHFENDQLCHALAIAALRKHLSVMKQLLDHPGINVHVPDSIVDTFLKAVIDGGDKEIIQLLQEFIARHPPEDGMSSPQTSPIPATGHPFDDEEGSNLSPNDDDRRVPKPPSTTRDSPPLSSHRSNNSATIPPNEPALAVDDTAQPPCSEKSHSFAPDVPPSGGSTMNFDVESPSQLDLVHDAQQGSSSADAINTEPVPTHSNASPPLSRPEAPSPGSSQGPSRPRRRDRLLRKLLPFGKKS